MERCILCAQRGGRQRTHGKSSEQRATKRRHYGREVEGATRDATETGQKRSRASSAQRNGNGTKEKSSEQCATERKRDVRESERKMSNATTRDGGEERAGNEVGKNYVSRPQLKLN